MTDGEKHLREFADTRSERSFSALVDSYSGLVYGVAARRTGDVEMAKEVTQNVFLIVMRKAGKLARRDGFAAWLHRATTLESLNFRRAEGTRRRKMDDYENEIAVDCPGADHEMGEVLDEALDRLQEQDRRALSYRFFEGRDFEEIGGLLGKSAAAAQKQTRRAVEKLAEVLKRRGIAISATGLSGVLGVEFAKAAPPAVKAAVLAASQHVGTAAGWTSFFSKPALISAGVVALLMSFPIADRAGRIADQKGHPVVVGELAPSRDKGSRLSGLPVKSGGRRGSGSGAELLPEEITGELLVGSWIRANGGMPQVFTHGPAFGEISEAMRGMETEQLWRLVAEIDRAIGVGEEASRISREQIISQRLAWRDPQRAIEYAVEHRLKDEVLEKCIAAWHSKEPEAARQWFDFRIVEPGFERTRLLGDGPADALLKGIVHSTAGDDLAGAVRLVESFAATPRYPAAVDAVVPALRAAGDHTSFLRLAGELPDGDFLELATHYSSGLMAICLRRDESVASPLQALLAHPDFPQSERSEILLGAASSVPQGREDLAMGMLFLASDAPRRAGLLVALADSFTEGRPDYFEERRAVNSPELAAAVAAAYALLIESLAISGDERATRYLPKISDPELRGALAELIQQPVDLTEDE